MQADYYIFNADILCADCAEEQEREIKRNVKNISDLEFLDSNCLPQPVFFSENDFPCHCRNCGVFIGNGLTSNGIENLIETFRDYLEYRNGNRETILTWYDFYFRNYNLDDYFTEEETEKLETILNETEQEEQSING